MTSPEEAMKWKNFDDDSRINKKLKPLSIDDIKKKAQEFIQNMGRRPQSKNMSSRPQSNYHSDNEGAEEGVGDAEMAQEE
jgi:hypothetical protein